LGWTIGWGYWAAGFDPFISSVLLVFSGSRDPEPKPNPQPEMYRFENRTRESKTEKNAISGYLGSVRFGSVFGLDVPSPILQDVVRGINESEESFQTRQCDHADKIAKRDLDRANWLKNNKKCLKIMQTKMSEVIRASIPEKKSDGVDHTATEFLAIVEKQHDTHSKTFASTMINKLTSL
jgi:hypothetical protein